MIDSLLVHLAQMVVLPVRVGHHRHEGILIMGAPKKIQLPADVDEWFPQGLYLVGEIVSVMEYQPQE